MRGFHYIALCFLVQISFAQRDLRERLVIHSNGNFFVTGQELAFTTFVTSASTGQLSDLSKILYVELLNDEMVPVMQTKLLVEKGIASGQFFIGSLLPTGNYHLVCYTRWMKNIGDFERYPIAIVNPYQDYANPVLSEDLSITAYPEGGKLVTGHKNRVVVSIQDSRGVAIEFSGRVVDEAGSKVTDVAGSGVAMIEISPKRDQKYQLIIDRDGELLFYDLISSCSDCATVRITKTPGMMQAKALYGSRFDSKDVELILRDEQDTLVSNRDYLSYQAERQTKDTWVQLIDPDGEIATRQVTRFDLASAKIPSRAVGQRTNVDTKSSLRGSMTIYPYHGSSPADTINREANLIAYPDKPAPIWPKEVKLMPEFRNDLLTGIVKNSYFQPVADATVAMSIPGKDYVVRLANTDEEGRFLIDIDPRAGNLDAYLTVVDNNKKTYEISLDNEFYDSYDLIETRPIFLDSARLGYIKQISLNLQVENAFYEALEVEQDTLDPIPQFYDYKRYRLDEYTRFRTIRDTFIEFIPEVGVSKNEKDFNFNIRLKDGVGYEKAGNEYLLLFDGIPAKAQEVFEYSPFNIESIDILNRRYYFGEVVIDGIIAFNTLGGDFYDFNSSSSKVMYYGLQPERQPVKIDHENTRKPDRRTHLHWASGKLNSDAVTSDVLGTYTLSSIVVGTDGRLSKSEGEIIVR